MLDLLRISEPALITSVEGKKYAALYVISYATKDKPGWFIAVEVNEKNEYQSGTPCFLVATPKETFLISSAKEPTP